MKNWLLCVNRTILLECVLLWMMLMVHTLVLVVCLAGLVATTPYISQESDESTEVGGRTTTSSAVLGTEVDRSIRDSSSSSENKDSSSSENKDSSSSENKDSSSSENKDSSSSEDKDSSSSENKDSSSSEGSKSSGDLATLVPETSGQSDEHSSRPRRDTSSEGSAPRKILPTIREEPPSRVARAEPDQEPGADKPERSPEVTPGPQTRRQQASSQISLRTPPIHPVGRFARGAQEPRTPQGPRPAQKPLSDNRSPGLSRQGPTDIRPGVQQSRPDTEKIVDRPKPPHF